MCTLRNLSNITNSSLAAQKLMHQTRIVFVHLCVCVVDIITLWFCLLDSYIRNTDAITHKTVKEAKSQCYFINNTNTKMYKHNTYKNIYLEPQCSKNVKNLILHPRKKQWKNWYFGNAQKTVLKIPHPRNFLGCGIN